eukprot:Nitzschia sp. Nitz4//scaffold3_size479765//378541//380566//NITZ4_000160-RA/size479765-snap-gene-1.376-mRNA-1//1//CDS//3329550938//8319//frame0
MSICELQPLGFSPEQEGDEYLIGPNSEISPLLIARDGSFRISLQQVVLETTATRQAGCAIGTRAEHLRLDASDFYSHIHSVWNNIASDEKLKVRGAIERLLTEEWDSLDELLRVRKILPSPSKTGDLDWFMLPSLPLLKLTLLRRLALPMFRYDKCSPVTLSTMGLSLIDLLLESPDFKELVSTSISQQIARLSDILTQESTKDQLAKWHIEHLKKTLSKSLLRVGEKHASPIQSSKNKIGTFMLLPRKRVKMDHAIRNKLKHISSDLDARRNGSSRTPATLSIGVDKETPFSVKEGLLVISENNLSLKDFRRERILFKQLNKALPRQFHPGKSRPLLQVADITPTQLTELRSIFFDEDGSLSNAIVEDVDLSTRHGYINFSNVSCTAERADRRWQVPLQRHGIENQVVARTRVENLLEGLGLLSKQHEHIHDMGILIGGTEDQSLHHDIPRQMTAWAPNPLNDGVEIVHQTPVAGWEHDRAAYNEAMASPYAPSSILLGMSHSGRIEIGIQADQIERYGVVNGRSKDPLRIVRENVHLVVVEANPGVTFTGDFRHAGVRNFPVGSQEDNLMVSFCDKVDEICFQGEELEDGHDTIVKKLIEMMCGFKNLNQISRFHCSTEPSQSPLQIPRNTVGFVNCTPNPP